MLSTAIHKTSSGLDSPDSADMLEYYKERVKKIEILLKKYKVCLDLVNKKDFKEDD